MTEQVAALDVDLIQESDQIQYQLSEVVWACIRAFAVSALVVGDDSAQVFEPFQLIVKVELGAGKTVHQNKGFTFAGFMECRLYRTIGNEIGDMHEY